MSRFETDLKWHRNMRELKLQTTQDLVEQAHRAQQQARYHMAAEHDHYLTPLEATYAAVALEEVRRTEDSPEFGRTQA